MGRENTPKSIRKSLHLLPQHIIEEEILSRLPVKSLFRFRCVSKSWACLIHSKRFMKTHLRNSSRNTAFQLHRLILNCREGIRIKQFSPQLMLDGSIDPTPIDDPNINQLKSLRIVGCLNGVACILYNNQSFVFWNPSTRNFKKLPQLHDEDRFDWCILSSGFGWDKSSDNYKVFAAMYMLTADEVIGKVYSSKTNSWKKVEHMHFSRKRNSIKTVELMYLPLICEEGIFVGGKLHWSRYEGERNIACFDLKTEVCGKIELPYKYNDEESDSYSEVGVIGGCLSSVKFYSRSPTEVWVMKEYGVKDSWSKLVSLSHVQELIQLPLSAAYAVGGRDGDVFLFFGRFFLVYYPRRNEFRRLWQFDDSVREAKICVESLVWPQLA